MTITINVPDELAEEVGQWEDGATYDLATTQRVAATETAPGEHDLISGEVAKAEEDEAEGAESEMGGDEKGGMIGKKIPAAIAVLIKGK